MYNRDGVIWCVDVDKVNQHLPAALREMLDRRSTSIFTMEMLDRIGDSYDALNAFSREPYAFFFEPASTVNRIANQYALFSLTTDPAVLIHPRAARPAGLLQPHHHPEGNQVGNPGQAGLHQHLRADDLPRPGRHLQMDHPAL